MESPKTIYPINLWFHEKVQLIFALKYVLCMLCNHFLPETSNNFSENPCWNIFWNSFYLTHHFDCVFVQNLILDCPNSCDNIRYVWRPWNWKKKCEFCMPKWEKCLKATELILALFLLSKPRRRKMGSFEGFLTRLLFKTCLKKIEHDLK